MELNKKVKIFGKQIPAVLLALLAIAGLASAGLLSYYGMITGMATVEQSVRIYDPSTDKEYIYNTPVEYTTTVVAGNTDTKTVTLKNYAKTSTNVAISTVVTNSTDDVVTGEFTIEYKTGTNCDIALTSPVSLDAATDSGPSTKQLCIIVTPNIAQIPGRYTITTTVSPSS